MNVEVKPSALIGWPGFLLLLAVIVHLPAPAMDTGFYLVILLLTGCAIGLTWQAKASTRGIPAIAALVLALVFVLCISRVRLQFTIGGFTFSAQFVLLGLTFIFTWLPMRHTPPPLAIPIFQAVLTATFLFVMLPAMFYDSTAAARCPRAWLLGLCFLQLIGPYHFSLAHPAGGRRIFRCCLAAAILVLGKCLSR